MLCFKEWLAAIDPDLSLCPSSPPLFEGKVPGGDDGLQAFIDSQNRVFKDFLSKLLGARKITDPRLVQEAERLIADHANGIFNYGAELLKIASGGRGRLAGGDTLQAATEAAGEMWEKLWQPGSYAGTQTWETRFPMSVNRGGIVGTVRGFANNLIGHFAQRLRKSRGGVSTVQRSQIEAPIDPEARIANPEGEWEEWKTAILRELEQDLNAALARSDGGKHWEARVRNLRWAITIAAKQMDAPYQWRSMPAVMADIPGLQGIGRGGLQQALKGLIDSARNRVVAKMGSSKEQAVAHWLQTRGHRAWGQAQAEGMFPQFATEDRASALRRWGRP